MGVKGERVYSTSHLDGTSEETVARGVTAALGEITKLAEARGGEAVWSTIVITTDLEREDEVSFMSDGGHTHEWLTVSVSTLVVTQA